MLQISNQPAKCEEVDKEIEEIAKQIRLANEKRMVQSKNVQLTHNTQALEKPPGNDLKPEDWALLCDRTSIQGQFGWTEISNMTIPYLFRFNEKYVSLRMADTKILFKYKNMFTDELHSCFRVKVFHVTLAEAQLLNEINFRHCDNLYGRLQFTPNDNIVGLQDLIEMYEFLNFCYLKLVEKVAVPQNRCGFIKIASQNCVPYVCHENKHYVPLFYFEGECSYLEEQSIELSGWALSYLKLYCKIQGIRKVLFDGLTVRVVQLELVKKFFPPDTTFEKTWPSDYSTDLLLQRPVPKLIYTQTLDKSKAMSNNVNTQEDVLKENQVDLSKNGLNSQKQLGSVPPSTIIQSTQLVSQHRSSRPIAYNSQYSTATTYQNASVIKPTSKPVVASKILPKFVPIPASSVVNPVDHQKTLLNNKSVPSSNASNNFKGHNPSPILRPLTVPKPNQSSRKLLQIPDVFCKNGYYLIKIQVENKTLQYCINMEPFSTTILLVSLEEISTFFNLPIPSVTNAVNAMNLDIFLPNKMQKKEFKKYKIYSTVGLLKIRDFLDNLPQLRFILNGSS